MEKIPLSRADVAQHRSMLGLVHSGNCLPQQNKSFLKMWNEQLIQNEQRFKLHSTRPLKSSRCWAPPPFRNSQTQLSPTISDSSELALLWSPSGSSPALQTRPAGRGVPTAQAWYLPSWLNCLPLEEFAHCQSFSCDLYSEDTPTHPGVPDPHFPTVYILATPSVLWGPEAWASPGSLLETQTPRAHPDFLNREPQFNRDPGDSRTR